MGRFEFYRAAKRLALAAGLMLGTVTTTVAGSPTVDEYAAYAGNAKVVPGGQLKLDDRTVTCGHRPTVLDNNLDDYGAAFPGFIILNPKLLTRVATPVKLWIYSHECAHQFRGPDEETADCFAVQRGRRQGWLTEDGLNQVCEFIRPAKGSMMHLTGSKRCEAMRVCYGDSKVH